MSTHITAGVLHNQNGGLQAVAIGTAVLSREQSEKLEHDLLAPFITDKTTELQAGFMLGLQHVLLKLRHDYVRRS